MIKRGFIPPRSPLSLLQEDLFPNEFLIIVSCMMLNQTTRKQVEKVLPTFMLRWSDPISLFNASPNDVLEVIKPLGFGNRRTVRLYELALTMIDTPCGPLWKDPRDLPGVGEYAARAHEIFCQGILGNCPPVDHALLKYWTWAQQNKLFG